MGGPCEFLSELGLCAINAEAFLFQERITKCLCIQAAHFPPGCVVGHKIVLKIALAIPASILALPPCRDEKTLAFGATIHFVISSYFFNLQFQPRLKQFFYKIIRYSACEFLDRYAVSLCNSYNCGKTYDKLTVPCPDLSRIAAEKSLHTTY
jgi:hypothetical protein